MHVYTNIYTHTNTPHRHTVNAVTTRSAPSSLPQLFAHDRRRGIVPEHVAHRNPTCGAGTRELAPMPGYCLETPHPPAYTSVL